MKIVESPTYKLAVAHNIPVHTPSDLKSEETLRLISSINADIIIVIAYGHIIPKSILNAKKYGCLNIHPSDLPKYRGAAPIHHTIIQGETKTAVCIIKMDEGLDTGEILSRQEFNISNKITFRELHDKTAELGAVMLLELLKNNNIDRIVPMMQHESKEGQKYAYKLSKEESKVDWNESAFLIDNKVRAMNPWPGIFFEYQGKRIKIIEAEAILLDHKNDPGTVIRYLNNFFVIACGKDILKIIRVQPENRKVIDARQYLFNITCKKNIKLC